MYLKECFTQKEKGTETERCVPLGLKFYIDLEEYQELDKISGMWNPVPDILEKATTFLDTDH